MGKGAFENVSGGAYRNEGSKSDKFLAFLSPFVARSTGPDNAKNVAHLLWPVDTKETWEWNVCPFNLSGSNKLWRIMSFTKLFEEIRKTSNKVIQIVLFLIHEVDPHSRWVVIIVFAHVCTSVHLYNHFSKQNKFHKKQWSLQVRLCVSGQVDHWRHLSYPSYFIEMRQYRRRAVSYRSLKSHPRLFFFLYRSKLKYLSLSEWRILQGKITNDLTKFEASSFSSRDEF